MQLINADAKIFLRIIKKKKFAHRKLKKLEKIGYHSNFNFECNTERVFKESLSIALGSKV